MIRLHKQTLPEELTNRIASRTARLISHLQSGTPVPESLLAEYRDPEIKALLKLETFEKCAYCESKVTHLYYGDVEHIIPKSVDRAGTFSYANLTFVCAICNNNKRDYYDQNCPLVNPFVEDPDHFLMAVGPLIFGRPGNVRGKCTELRLQLNRPPLMHRRIEKLEGIKMLVDAAISAPIALQPLLWDQVNVQIAENQEYCMVGRAFVRQCEETQP